MIKVFRYRVYPSKIQETAITEQLEICRELYNKILELRKDSWENEHKSISMYETQSYITQWKNTTWPELRRVYSQVLQEVATTVDLAFANFFRRVRNGEEPGYPRFKGYGRLKSLIYKQAGFKLTTNNRLYLSKIGYVKIVQHRPIEGVVKRLIIKKTQTGKYYASFVVETVGVERLQPINKVVGIDLGVTEFITSSDYETWANPKYLEKSAKRPAKLTRKHKRLQTTKSRLALAKAHEKVANQRTDYYHKVANDLIAENQVIVLEDLDIKQMVENGWRRMNKAVLDAGWGNFVNILSYKAVEAGRTIIKVNPAYTSQQCSNCGHTARSNRKSQSKFVCNVCGFETNADYNAACNILSRGLATLDSS